MALTVRFGADEYDLATTWAASREFDDKIGDPLQMAMRLNTDPHGVFTATTAVRAIWIGIKHAGGKLTESEVGELCHANGIINYLQVANGLLISLVSGGPEDSGEDADEGEPKKK